MKPKDKEGSYLEQWAEDTIEEFLDLANGKYLLDFVNSPDGSKYGAKGLYEFLDFVHYLRSKENDEEIAAN